MHVQCTVQCTATKRCKYHGISFVWTSYRKCKNIFFFGVFSSLFEKIHCIYSFVAVRCGVHFACTVRALCKTRCVRPLCIFISRTLQFCFWRRGGTVYITAPCKTHQDTQFLISNRCPHVEQMLRCCFFVWWVAALKMKLHLDYFGLRVWQMQREFVQACVCTSIHEKNLLPVLQKKSFCMWSHHT